MAVIVFLIFFFSPTKQKWPKSKKENFLKLF